MSHVNHQKKNSSIISPPKNGHGTTSSEKTNANTKKNTSSNGCASDTNVSQERFQIDAT